MSRSRQLKNGSKPSQSTTIHAKVNAINWFTVSCSNQSLVEQTVMVLEPLDLVVRHVILDVVF